MKVLYLGPKSPLLGWLRQQCETVEQTEQPVFTSNADFLISYNYKHILSRAFLDLFPDRAINLHISLLPWNRGVDPNLWSFIDDTPKGVTIHYLNEGIDTGDIIAQKEVFFGEDETLATTYQTLQAEIQALFMEVWPSIRMGTCPRIPQPKEGSYHKSTDKQEIALLLTKGWDTPIAVLDSYAAETQMSRAFWEKYDREIEARRCAGPRRASYESYTRLDYGIYSAYLSSAGAVFCDDSPGDMLRKGQAITGIPRQHLHRDRCGPSGGRGRRCHHTDLHVPRAGKSGLTRKG